MSPIDLVAQGAWDAMKHQDIEEKLEKLGVEHGFSQPSGSNVPHIHAPHARAASVSLVFLFQLAFCWFETKTFVLPPTPCITMAIFRLIILFRMSIIHLFLTIILCHPHRFQPLQTLNCCSSSSTNYTRTNLLPCPKQPLLNRHNTLCLLLQITWPDK